MARTVFVQGGGTPKYQLIVLASAGSTVTMTKGELVKEAKDKNRLYFFKGLEAGEWELKCTLGADSYTEDVSIVDGAGCIVIDASYRVIPRFTYDGSFSVCTDVGSVISDEDGYRGNWTIRLLSSGTLVFESLNGARHGIDIFIVGGGGGGGMSYSDPDGTYAGQAGGPGYNGTFKNISIEEGNSYDITIGAGGAKATNNTNRIGVEGGQTIAFGKIVNGGKGSSNYVYNNNPVGAGGSETYAFGSSTMGTTKYSVRGGTVNNTGSGGPSGTNGQSGIAIIRNAREVAA